MSTPQSVGVFINDRGTVIPSSSGEVLAVVVVYYYTEEAADCKSKGERMRKTDNDEDSTCHPNTSCYCNETTTQQEEDEDDI